MTIADPKKYDENVKTSILTIQESADLLNVSQPYVVKLLDYGDLPGSNIDQHRRIKLADLLEYKVQQDLISRQALEKLAAEAQALGFY